MAYIIISVLFFYAIDLIVNNISLFNFVEIDIQQLDAINRVKYDNNSNICLLQSTKIVLSIFIFDNDFIYIIIYIFCIIKMKNHPYSMDKTRQFGLVNIKYVKYPNLNSFKPLLLLIFIFIVNSFIYYIYLVNKIIYINKWRRPKN